MTKKAAVAVAVVLVGMAIGALRLGMGSKPSAPAWDPDLNLPVEFTHTREAGGIRYARLQDTLPETIARKFAEASVSDPALADLATLRADLLFAPNFDRWAGHTSTSPRAEGWTPPEGDLRARWERQAAAFANPIVHADGVHVRRVDPTRDFPELFPGTLCVGPDFAVSAPLPEPSEFVGNPRAEAIEVFFPVTIKDAGGQSVPATVSFVFVRAGPRSDWEELTAYVYMGAEGFGRALAMPPI